MLARVKIWVDDIRPAPNGYYRFFTTDSCKKAIEYYEALGANIDVIDLDHDAGEFSQFGGDYIKILDWLEETGRNYPIHIHSMNPVGVQNMRNIIRKNNWDEV